MTMEIGIETTRRRRRVSGRAARGRRSRLQQSSAPPGHVDEAPAAHDAVLHTHLGDFPVAERTLIPAPADVDEQQIQHEQTKRMLSGVSRFNRSGRAAARAEAVRNAAAQVARLRMARLDSLERAQEYADAAWNRLLQHDPEEVRAALAHAYEPSTFPTTVADVWSTARSNGVTVSVSFGPVDLPQDMVLAAMGAAVLETVRRTVAACPSTHSVSVLLVTETDGDEPTARFIGQFDRESAAPSAWDANPAGALLDNPDALLCLSGPDRVPGPLDPSDLPGLGDLLASLPGPRR